MSTVPANPATQAAPEPLSMGEVLRVPIMRRLWYGQLISTFGDFLALFAAINYFAYQLKFPADKMTSLQIAYMLPIAVLGVLAGVFVDRWPLKPTMIVSDVSRALLCLLLLVAKSPLEFYGIFAVLSVFSSFFGPAQGVAIRSAVPLHGLRAANALMQQVMFGMRIIGPVIAGVLYYFLGARICYWGDSISFLCSATLIASLALTRPLAEALNAAEGGDKPPAPKGLASILPDMREGISFILHHAALLFVILALAAGMFVLGCFGPLIAVYVRDVIHGATGLYTWASTMIGIGMFVGVNFLNFFGKKVPNTYLVYGGLGGIAIGLCVLFALPYIWATMLGCLIIGIAVAGIVVPANTLIQQETPAALMGRVGSSTMSFVFGAQLLGLVLSGILADRLGVQKVFAVCAALLVLLVVAGKLFMEPHHEGATPATA
jgi:MFS family permease